MRRRGKPVNVTGIVVAELEEWIHKDSDRLNAIKCQALISLTKNVSMNSVCTVLNVTRETVRQWRKRLSAEGVEGLRAKAGRGRKTVLTEEIEADLKLKLLKPPMELGYNQAVWDGKLVCKYIEDNYSLCIAVRTAQVWLHRIGFSRQRPRYKFNKTDEVANEQFKSEVKKNFKK